MIDIINEIRGIKGSKAKIEFLSKYQDNDLLRLVLRMTYDKVGFVWGMTLKQVLAAPSHQLEEMGLIKAIAWMTNSLGVVVTGNAALESMHSIIVSVEPEEADIIKCIINRDLKLGLNVKSINKAIPNLIHQVEYMRCDIFKPGSKVQYPAYLQVKMDGTWRELVVEDAGVTLWTRQGHIWKDPALETAFKNAPKGRYIGELTIPGLTRVQSNGNINSDSPDYNNIHFTLWDYVTDPEKPYFERFESLREAMPESDLVHLVETAEVGSDQEALKLTSQWMQRGEEGGVLKDFRAKFKNGTSDLQLKIKHTIELDVRVTGFTDGKLSTSREGKVGAIEFKTDDGLIQGQCSGFSQATLDEITSNKSKYLGKIMSVQCNDLQLADGSNIYKLMHPRFIEFRDDKIKTDDLKRAKEMLELSYKC